MKREKTPGFAHFGLVALLLASLSVTACAGLLKSGVDSRTPASPDKQWHPARPVAPSLDTTDVKRNVPKEFLERQWTLEDIVDLALRNNPATRASWQAARASAAHYNSERGAWLPQIDGDVNFGRTLGSVGGKINYKTISTTSGVSLSYVLFNFGKRRAEVESARQEMLAHQWSHNATVQNVILAVEQAYYTYLYSKAIRQARESSLAEAKRDLEAAEIRRSSGLATVADVLQARTRAAQAELELQSVVGDIQTIRGSLATAMGLPADLDYDVDFLPEDVPLDSVTEGVDRYIEQARRERPDLAATRAQALQAAADLASTRAERYPELSLRGGASRVYYNSRDRKGDLHNFAISMHVPLFHGFSYQNDVLEAEAQAEQAKELYRLAEQRVVLDVWRSYYDLKTAGSRLKTSRALLESATESHKVAGERYKAGVGSILELLQAQSALEDARAQNIQARTDWFLSLARLAHDTGALGLTETSLVPTGENKSNEGER